MLVSCGSFSRRGMDFLLTTMSRPHSGAHPASYPMDIRGSFPMDKVAGV